MTLPASVDWTPTYLAHLPPRWQIGQGSCQECSMLYAIELRAILQGLPVVQLSQLFMLWAQMNGGPYVTLGGGVCAENLWPITLGYGPDTAATGITDYQQSQIAMATKPTPAAFADAPNHTITDWGYFDNTRWMTDRAAMIPVLQTAIAAGYPLSCGMLYVPHELCVWGYDSGGVMGLDSRSTSRVPFHYSYDEIVPYCIVRSVAFSGPTSYPTIYPAYGFGPVSPPPPPPTSGNTQMLIDNIKAAGNGLTLGSITQVQIDAGKALWNQLVPDVAAPPVVPPVPPAPAGTSAAGTTTPPAASVTDNLGAVWTKGPHSEALRNGIDAKGFYTTQILWTGARIEAQQKDNGSWSFWNGSGWTWTGR